MRMRRKWDIPITAMSMVSIMVVGIARFAISTSTVQKRWMHMRPRRDIRIVTKVITRTKAITANTQDVDAQAGINAFVEKKPMPDWQDR